MLVKDLLQVAKCALVIRLNRIDRMLVINEVVRLHKKGGPFVHCLQPGLFGGKRLRQVHVPFRRYGL